MTARLRPVDDGALTEIGALHRRSRIASYAGLVPAAALTADTDEAMGAWWAERWRWERDTHRLTVAEADGTVVGFSYAGPSETDGAVELYAIHVEPGLVGTGVGRALMIGALADLEALAEPDTARAVLWVLEGNTRARAFYAAGGWTAEDVRRDAPIGPQWAPQRRYTRPLRPRNGGDLAGGSA